METLHPKKKKKSEQVTSTRQKLLKEKDSIIENTKSY